jgi:predicted O-linked N-acetylglucosamine transferase (SPINDLY family)
MELEKLITLLKVGDLAAADVIARDMRQKYPNIELVWFISADIEIIQGKEAAALEFVKTAIKVSQSINGLIAYALQHYNNSRFEYSSAVCYLTAERYQDEYNLYNLHGVILKQLKQFERAVEIFEKAIKLNSNEIMAYINMGNTNIAWQKYPEALECYNIAVELQPNNSETLRLQASAYIFLNKMDEAVEILNRALLEMPQTNPSVLVDLCAAYYNRRDYDKALEIITAGAGNFPKDPGVWRVKAIVLRQMGRTEEADKIFEEIMTHNPNDVETMIAFANAAYYGANDTMKAKHYYNLAYKQDPNNQLVMQKLCHFLMTARNTDTSEGENIDTAYEIAKRMVNVIPNVVSVSDAAQAVFLKVLDYEAYDNLGDRRAMMEYWITQCNIPTLTFQMSRVKTLEDRLYLIEAHKKWGAQIEEVASKHPVKRKVKQRLNNKIRLGILSSDLRHHPVGYFTWPLMEYLDRSQFEIYCYSFYPKQPDNIQQAFTARAESYTVFGEENSPVVAQKITDDCLDIMFELGGSTFFNRIDVCAYKPAPVQVSWLGYPNSIGLPTTIDYILVDPYINPENPNLLVEKPFLMPRTWVSLDKVGFTQTPITPVIPQDRNGYLTFGTMNMPHKLNPQVFVLWAYIMNIFPNSRFLYVRPETGSSSMRKNFCDHLGQYGINSDRISFVATRINHLDQYNNMDIVLDPFPHTGGTTTCESLWMGVPVVTLVGQSFYERLSYSNLNNAGLGDLCAFNFAQYKDNAVRLALDIERRRFLRQNLRAQIKQNPLGQPQLFAKDFGNTIKITLGMDRIAA